NVPDRSPPVPQVSNTLSYRLEICTARARIVFARPTISTGRSPFIARPISKPPVGAAAGRPSITSVIAADASSLVRSSCRVSFSIKYGNIIHHIHHGRRNRFRKGFGIRDWGFAKSRIPNPKSHPENGVV